MVSQLHSIWLLAIFIDSLPCVQFLVETVDLQVLVEIGAHVPNIPTWEHDQIPNPVKYNLTRLGVSTYVGAKLASLVKILSEEVGLGG